jgi:hypothetical protein
MHSRRNDDYGFADPKPRYLLIFQNEWVDEIFNSFFAFVRRNHQHVDISALYTFDQLMMAKVDIRVTLVFFFKK